jgi:hypothetical protein
MMAPMDANRMIAHAIRLHDTSEIRIMHMALRAKPWTRRTCTCEVHASTNIRAALVDAFLERDT